MNRTFESSLLFPSSDYVDRSPKSLEPTNEEPKAKQPRVSLPATPYTPQLRNAQAVRRPTPILKSVNKRQVDPSYKPNVFTVDDESPRAQTEIGDVSSNIIIHLYSL
jgi:hypothetical protein